MARPNVKPAEVESETEEGLELDQIESTNTAVVDQAELNALRAAAAELASLKQKRAISKPGNAAHVGMTEVVSLRNFRLATKTGHVIWFEAKKPKWIPSIVVPHAMEAGCVPTSEVDTAMFDDRRKARAEFGGDMRRSLIAAFISDIIDTNNTKDFDASGQPKYQVVSALVGFDVTQTETIEVYRAVMGARNSGEDPQFHKNTMIVKRIIEADTKTDLLALVPETEITLEDAKGMQTKDLRKAMLSTFQGLTTE